MEDKYGGQSKQEVKIGCLIYTLSSRQNCRTEKKMKNENVAELIFMKAYAFTLCKRNAPNGRFDRATDIKQLF